MEMKRHTTKSNAKATRRLGDFSYENLMTTSVPTNQRELDLSPGGRNRTVSPGFVKPQSFMAKYEGGESI